MPSNENDDQITLVAKDEDFPSNPRLAITLLGGVFVSFLLFSFLFLYFFCIGLPIECTLSVREHLQMKEYVIVILLLSKFNYCIKKYQKSFFVTHPLPSPAPLSLSPLPSPLSLSPLSLSLPSLSLSPLPSPRFSNLLLRKYF